MRYGSEFATEPVVFDVDGGDVTNTYSVPILDSMRTLYCYAVVKSLSYNRYSVVSGFSDIKHVRQYLLELADAGDTDERRIYFWESGTWFGQVLITPIVNWPDDREVRQHARRNHALKQLGADVPCVMEGAR